MRMGSGLSAVLGAVLLAALSSGALSQATTLQRADGAAIPIRLSGDWSDRACPPTMLVSHGFGGDESGLSHVEAAGREAGYRVLTMGHAESGPASVQRFFAGGRDPLFLASPEIWRGRAADLDAALAYATRACRPTRLVLAGYSMGAALSVAEAGGRPRFDWPHRGRFDAYVAVSQQGVGWAFTSPGAWWGITAPVLMVTGTQDAGLDGEWQRRLAAFEGLPPGQKRLAVIDGANHLNLGGMGSAQVERQVAELVREFLALVKKGRWAQSALAGSGAVKVTDK
jgi:pimeloyl-ACP methyl ester carboxylesterase